MLKYGYHHRKETEMKGKYAIRTTGVREQRLADEVERLKQELAAEKAGRKDDAHAHDREVAKIKREFAGEVAEQVNRALIEKIERHSAGLSAATWRVQRIEMTKQLSWLFFKGYLDWNRVEGDLEMLAFILAHGDIDAWFLLADRHYQYADRKEMRQVRRKPYGLEGYLQIEEVITKALSGSADARRQREVLDTNVEAARSAFISVELDDLNADFGGNVGPTSTEDQRVLHQLVSEAIPQYQERFRETLQKAKHHV